MKYEVYFIGVEFRVANPPQVGFHRGPHPLLSPLKVITHQTDKMEMEIFKQEALLRRMAMELLFRYGGLQGVEIAQIMGIDYSTVSKERKLLKETLKNDKGLRLILVRKEGELRKVKI